MTDDTDDSVNILVHGPTCIHWVEPTKTSDYVVLALKEVPTDQGYTAWMCPMCEKVVLELWDYGTIDFGTEPLPPEPEDGFMDMEFFEPIAEEPPPEQ